MPGGAPSPRLARRGGKQQRPTPPRSSSASISSRIGRAASPGLGPAAAAVISSSNAAAKPLGGGSAACHAAFKATASRSTDPQPSGSAAKGGPGCHAPCPGSCPGRRPTPCARRKASQGACRLRRAARRAAAGPRARVSSRRCWLGSPAVGPPPRSHAVCLPRRHQPETAVARKRGETA